MIINIPLKKFAYLLFIFGFSFYCIFPLISLIFFTDIWSSDILINKYNDLYINEFLILIFIFYLFFSLGYWVKLRDKYLYKSDSTIKITNGFDVFITFFYALFFLMIVDLSEILNLAGYTNDYDVVHRGQLTTLYLTSLFWIIYLKAGTCMRIMVFIYIVAGLNLLSLGSRLGVVSGIIGMIIFYFYSIKSTIQFKLSFFRLINFFIFVAIAVFSVSIIGIIREGQEINGYSLLNILTAEPLFIYSSVPAYLSNNFLPLISIPVDILSSIIGAIPSLLYENKVDLFNSMNSIPDGSSSGMGGANHVLIILLNFGLIGMPIFSFFEGLWFGYLVNAVKKNAFMRAVSISSVAAIPFILFREGFQTSIKLLFFNYLLFPFLIIKGYAIVYKIIRLSMSIRVR